jgi:hypothetical protein
MPLHTHHPVGVACPLYRFDHAIRRARHDAQMASRLEDRLVMRAVHHSFARSSYLRQARTRFDSHGMQRLWLPPIRVPVVLNRPRQFARDILNQRAGEKSVQALNAVANGEYRLLFFERVLQQGKIRPLPIRVRVNARGMPLRAEAGRLDIRRAARQQDRIERLRNLLKMPRRETERDHNWLTTGLSRCVNIRFDLVEIASKLFFSSTIRDSYTTFRDQPASS